MSVTLKDVAEKLGVTITTVHKALNGKEGVSEKRRAEIMKVAAQMGYKVNYMASSLSKKKFHIAVVLPNTDGDNRFYYGALWDGIRNYLDTVSEFPITVSEYAYPLTRDGNGLVLEKIFNQDSDDLQGLITIAMDHDRSSYFLEKFAKKQIPVVLIGADLHTDFRLCCIKANDTAVGYLAAELLTAFLPSGYPAKILMAGDYGCLGMEDQRLNMQAFSAYLHTYAPSIETVPFQGSDPLAVSKEIRQYLTVHPDTYAIYTCSARFTYHISQCIRQLGIQDRIQVIGNDLFTESVQHGFGIGAGVVGTDIYRRRRNVRILFHRQRKERNEPYHQNQYGDGDSHHRPFYKYVSFHLNGSLIVDKIAIIISLAFLRAAVRHLWKQSRHPLSVRPAPRIRVRHLFLPR